MPPPFSLNTLPDMLNIVRDNRNWIWNLLTAFTLQAGQWNEWEKCLGKRPGGFPPSDPAVLPGAASRESATVHSGNVSPRDDTRQQEVAGCSHTSHACGSEMLPPNESQVKTKYHWYSSPGRASSLWGQRWVSGSFGSGLGDDRRGADDGETGGAPTFSQGEHVSECTLNHVYASCT